MEHQPAGLTDGDIGEILGKLKRLGDLFFVFLWGGPGGQNDPAGQCRQRCVLDGNHPLGPFRIEIVSDRILRSDEWPYDGARSSRKKQAARFESPSILVAPAAPGRGPLPGLADDRTGMVASAIGKD